MLQSTETATEALSEDAIQIPTELKGPDQSINGALQSTAPALSSSQTTRASLPSIPKPQSVAETESWPWREQEPPEEPQTDLQLTSHLRSLLGGLEAFKQKPTTSRTNPSAEDWSRIANDTKAPESHEDTGPAPTVEGESNPSPQSIPEMQEGVATQTKETGSPKALGTLGKKFGSWFG
ncbi:hypothetical protein ABW20_dc0101185 [Dactylellina cionopaga]|nr:hypothetical protein ABW20_dc0101185 [Dactylellina cionopaga]